MARVPTPWSAIHILDSLVARSSGYFIYASTVIKFVDDPDYRPTERLVIVQGLQTESSDNPFYALDQLYAQILSGVPACRRMLQILLATITCSLTLNGVEDLFELEPGDTYAASRRLHSLLDISRSSRILKLHHASLRDFLWGSSASRS